MAKCIIDPQWRRVFVTRNYIDVIYFDLFTDTPVQARRKAEAAARHVRPDSRAVATDNGWIVRHDSGSDPVVIQGPGMRGDKPAIPGEMIAMGGRRFKGVYVGTENLAGGLRAPGGPNDHMADAIRDLVTAAEALVDHAKETFPHFEDTRGQADIAATVKAINRVLEARP